MHFGRRRAIRKLALSIVLLGFGLWAGVWLWYRPSAADRQAIESRYLLWHTALAEKRYPDAYALMSQSYRDSHSLTDFAEHFEIWGKPSLRLERGYSLRVHGSYARLYPYESRGFNLWCGPDYQWVKNEGGWFLTGEFTYYVD
jgi:hypothetical protein